MAVISGSQISLPFFMQTIYLPDNLQNQRFQVKKKFFQIIYSGLNLSLFLKFKDARIILFSL